MASSADNPTIKHKSERVSHDVHECERTVRRPATPKASAAPVKYSHSYTSSDTDSDPNNDEQHRKLDDTTTSRRKINHTSRRIVTRVSRQLVMEGGKVVADSGPQVVTRIKEDNEVEESEKKRVPKNGRAKALAAIKATKSASNSDLSASGNDDDDADDDAEASKRVLGEKREVKKTSHEVREENMQFRNEKLKQLSGLELHQKAISSPNELITLSSASRKSSKKKSKQLNASDSSSDDDDDDERRGKMVHYSNKGKKYEDTDEIVEISKLALDGTVQKEVKRTHKHQEFSDDEAPDENNEADALLRDGPQVSRTTRKNFDYVDDFDDTSAPPPGAANHNHDDDDDDDEDNNHARRIKQRPASSASRRSGDTVLGKYSATHSPDTPTSGRNERIIKTERREHSHRSQSDSDSDSHVAKHKHSSPQSTLRSTDISARRRQHR